MKAGWQTKRIGDAIKLEYGKPLPKEDRDNDGSHPVYGANGEIGRTNKFYYDKPSIIVGRKGSAGEINLTEEKFWPLDVTYFVTFDEAEYNLQFLTYLLQTLNLPSMARGVKPGINRNDVYRLESQFPPLPEQKRIVAMLDEAFAGIDAAIANTEKNLAHARELFESYLNAVFTQKGDGWVEKKLGDFAISVSTGPFGSLLHKSDYVSEGVPLVNPINIIGNIIVPDKNKLIDASTKQRLQSYVLQKRDIVIGRRGEIGRCAVIDSEHDGWLCGTGCFFIRPRPSVNSHFLASLIRSNEYREQLERASTGATMKNLSNKALANLMIAIPSIEEQSEILTTLDDLASETQRLESIYQQKLDALAELKQSVLQKAFRGEL